MHRCLLPSFCFECSISDGLRIDLELLPTVVTRRQAFGNEAGPEYGCQSPANVVAECEADSASTGVGYPVALGCKGAAGDGVGEFFEASIGRESFGWNSL